MLNEFWFGTIAVLWAGFVLLEGFDFGVGMLLPVLGRTESERRVVLRTIGPTWDGNEVWLLVAGGATFAAFPEWYATVFSGYYLPLALILLGLILRGVCLEYRHKVDTDRERRWCDRGLVLGSLLPSVLLGVALADWIRGQRMDATFHITDSFWQLVTPYAMLGGLTSLLLFAFHGALFVALRTTGELRERALHQSRLLGPAAVLVAAGWLVWSLGLRARPLTFLLAGVMAVALLFAVREGRAGRERSAFLGTALTALLTPVFVFASTYPYVLPGRAGSTGLSIEDASSSPYTLKVMTVVALVLTPVVLVYQGWTYWIFRHRITDPALPSPTARPGRTTRGLDDPPLVTGAPG
ncbi:MAG: Cytochrome bd-I ubiquinol oxidase subunit 2 apoprotein [Frankiales bacterium]|nr:Cytochrome bd-I ubiquinol oxidase subunit 2 apoprotein [Frankiales bacterium]